jgi:hypothetical protein
MFHDRLTAAVAFWAVAAIALSGCGHSTPQPDPSAKPQSRGPTTELQDNIADRSLSYVTCRAALTAFVKDHPWSDDGSAGHDVGMAPLASLRLAEPAAYADRTVGILFKDAADAATKSPEEADIGRQFSVEIPKDFLKGTAKTIDNTSIGSFRKIEP